jgi:hypothetical protein
MGIPGTVYGITLNGGVGVELPSAFTAITETRYSTPFTKLSIKYGIVGVPIDSYDTPLFIDNKYVMIGVPPSYSGALKNKLAFPFSGSIAVMIGLFGRVYGVIDCEGVGIEFPA